MQQTLLTTDELAERIKYSARYICRHLLDNKLIEGVHYVRPFNGRKILFCWERIEEEIFSTKANGIPMAAGGVYYG